MHSFIKRFLPGGRHYDAVLVCMVVLVAMLFRRIDSFIMPQLYAEDGQVFLHQVVYDPLRSLVTCYAGYLHTVIRIVSFICWALHIDLLYVPLFYNLATLVITMMVALYLFRCAKLLSLRHPVIFATSFMFVPLGSEIFMNLTNINWFVALYLVGYIFVEHRVEALVQVSAWKRFQKLIVIAIISLSGPVSLILSPIIALIVLLERKQMNFHRLLPFAVIVFCGIIQLFCIRYSGTNYNRVVNTSPETDHLLKSITNNASATVYMSEESFSMPVRMATGIFVCLVLGWVLALCLKRMQVPRKYVPLLATLLYFASFVAVSWPSENLTLALQSPRYFFVPYACIMWMLVMGIDKRLGKGVSLAYLVFWLFHSNSIHGGLPNMGWKIQVMEYRLGMRNKLNLFPIGWEVRLPPQPAPRIFDSQYFPSNYYEQRHSVAVWGEPVSSKIIYLPAGKYKVVVLSEGDPCKNVYPQNSIYINDKKLGDFESRTYGRSEAFDYVQEKDGKAIIKFTLNNDESSAETGQDRNTFINAVLVYDDPPRTR